MFGALSSVAVLPLFVLATPANLPHPERPSCLYSTGKGGGLFDFQTPPPSRPPKVFELVLLQFEILGESVGAEGAKIYFFFCPPEGFLFLRWVSILKILRIL